MSTSTAADSIRATHLGYGTRLRYAVALAAASVAITAGVAIAINGDGGSSSTSSAAQPTTINRAGFGFEPAQASSVAAAQAFNHRTGGTLRATASRDVLRPSGQGVLTCGSRVASRWQMMRLGCAFGCAALVLMGCGSDSGGPSGGKGGRGEAKAERRDLVERDLHDRPGQAPREAQRDQHQAGHGVG